MSCYIVLFAGCLPADKNGKRLETSSKPPAAALPQECGYKQPLRNTPSSTPTAPLAPEAIMAIVDGKPIYMSTLYKPLLEAYGLRFAEILISNVIVQQEAQRRKITVTPADIAAENNHAIENIFGKQLPANQRQKALENLLQKRGIPPGLWRTIIHRNALLRKMVEPQVKITEEMVKNEYISRYTEKVQIRHIQLATISDAQKILKMLNSGNDFDKLARRYSTNTQSASRGGLLPPFTRNDKTIPAAIRETAFSLSEGQISGIVQAGDSFHILKLERRFLPPPTDYEKVKDRLRREIRERIITRLQSKLLAELREKAKVEYVNQFLKRRHFDYQQRK